ncbi:structural maintenance of chromosomes protein [Anaeramoeba flamelloides]|uniref:Structural maintenance of chromosomes protein 5 n=1 Tax=Anaeramoeba flamelloides TaxID=1746091 RepID=A0AAV8A3E9_9EUKA|nr:structural maintenance of chromosomes protein [Anaeramoeba flamelloides]
MSSSSKEVLDENTTIRKRKINLEFQQDLKFRRNNTKQQKQKISIQSEKLIEVVNENDTSSEEFEDIKASDFSEQEDVERKDDFDDETEINFNLSNFDPKETKEYKIGSIIRLYMKNFMTFKECEFYPGPRLNLILGANGTGKSSIITAIALALGAHTKIFRRQENMKEFIKFEEEESYLEIELYMGPKKENLTIERRIYENRSSWKLDGKKVTEKIIQQVTKKFGIQTNNLCQFLPQDRVYKFSAMSPSVLLEKTESVIAPELYQKHLSLKNNQQKQEGIELQIEKLKHTRISIKQKNLSIQGQVQNYLKLSQLRDDLLLLEKKLVYLKYNEAKRSLRLATEELDRIRNEQKKIIDIYNPILDMRKKISLTQDQVEKKIQIAYRNVKLGNTNLQENLKTLETLENKVFETHAKIKTSQNNKKKIADEIAKKTEESEELNRQMNKFNFTEIKKKLKKINHQIKQITHLQLQLQRKKLDIKNRIREKNQKLQRVKQSINQLRHDKMRVLRAFQQGNQNHVLDAYHWIQNNRSLFKKPIFGPVALETFIFQTEEDLEIFYREGFQKNKFKVPCKYFISNQRKYPRKINDEVKNKYKIDKFLDEVIECTPLVFEYLKYFSQIHNCALTRTKNIKVIEGVLNNTPLGCIFTPERRYLRRRTYIGTNSTMIHTINKSVLYGDIQESKKELDLQKKIKKIVQKIEASMTLAKEIQNDEDEQAKNIRKLFQQKTTLDNDLKKYKNLQAKKQILQKQIEINSKHKDFKSEIFQLNKELKQISKERESKIINLPMIIRQYLEAVSEENFEKMKKQLLKAQENKIKSQVHQQDFELDEINRKVFDQEVHVKRLKDECLISLTRRKEKYSELNQELIMDFEELSDSSDEIAEMINILQTQISLKPNVPKTVYDLYNDREKQKIKLTEIIKKKYQELNDNKNNIKEIEKAWLKGITEIVKKINCYFSKLFSKLGAVGEVQLFKDPGGDYSKFELNILTKFRDDNKLHTLKATRQSGGEKSMTTALYLVALQNLIDCPFRVVDELNQGMDPQNEKTIFNLIVKFICRPNLPQYFYITPKLLSNLNLTKDINCHIIFNSPFIPKYPKLWLLPNIVKFNNRVNPDIKGRKRKILSKQN